ncbi:uroporphyrinogen decarboxylase family protein [Acetobacterium tundrae]|uniref:Uroporphyrinogen decarboxylase (URO-D) domain-containing protein n=1 Tax=Acetobacterium tundrae TaxID=132932 RepID=A0ABR6WQ94_9FIRM|nr:uroporphyrinogen decarboxylase family protein [Acetobacterium tundrae]MBC3798644.1 hypothetical protein [Acetobacterium tundrae]
MSKITERENFYRMVNKEQPDFVPHQPSLLQMVLPRAIEDRAPGFGTGYDWFGVHWTEDPEMPMMPVATANMPVVLEDICDWHEVIKWPDLSAIDWEACAKEDVPEKDPTKILCAMLISGPFERLHDLMGFENALCSLMTDPDECEAFFAKLCDFKIDQLKYLKKYYDIDMVHFQDDWGSQKDLFFNPQIWRDLIKPHVTRVINAAHELDILFDMHSCGKIDRIVDEIIEMGVDVLDPVQPINDLQQWNNDYHGKLIFMGALDAQNVIDSPSSSEEDIKVEVHEKTDLFATNGYYIPFAVALSSRVMDALNESFIYGRTFYSDKYAEDVSLFIAQSKLKTNTVSEPSLVPGMDLNIN